MCEQKKCTLNYTVQKILRKQIIFFLTNIFLSALKQQPVEFFFFSLKCKSFFNSALCNMLHISRAGPPTRVLYSSCIARRVAAGPLNARISFECKLMLQMYRGGGLIILLSATHADSLIKPGGKKPMEDHYDTVRKTTLCLSINIHGL